MTLQTQPAIEARELPDEERAAKFRELLDSEPLPMIQKSIDAFRRDLPELLQTHPGKWVAYGRESANSSGTLRWGFASNDPQRLEHRGHLIEEQVFPPPNR